jgi:hypothetical protein
MPPRGLYDKYRVHRPGHSTEPLDGCFVLRPAHDPHARVALAAYAESVEPCNPALAHDLRAWLLVLRTERAAWLGETATP